MRFVVRQLHQTRHGHEYVCRSVDIPDDDFAKWQQWASAVKPDLVALKSMVNGSPESTETADKVYASYTAFRESMGSDYLKLADRFVGLSQFFCLCMDNPEMIADV